MKILSVVIMFAISSMALSSSFNMTKINEAAQMADQFNQSHPILTQVLLGIADGMLMKFGMNQDFEICAGNATELYIQYNNSMTQLAAATTFRQKTIAQAKVSAVLAQLPILSLQCAGVVEDQVILLESMAEFLQSTQNLTKFALTESGRILFSGVDITYDLDMFVVEYLRGNYFQSGRYLGFILFDLMFKKIEFLERISAAGQIVEDITFGFIMGFGSQVGFDRADFQNCIDPDTSRQLLFLYQQGSDDIEIGTGESTKVKLRIGFDNWISAQELLGSRYTQCAAATADLLQIGTRLVFAVEEAKHPKLLYIEALKVFTLNRSEIMTYVQNALAAFENHQYYEFGFQLGEIFELFTEPLAI